MLFFLLCLPPHAVLDVAINDEVHLLLGKAVVPGKDTIDFVEDGFRRKAAPFLPLREILGMIAPDSIIVLIFMMF